MRAALPRRTSDADCDITCLSAEACRAQPDALFDIVKPEPMAVSNGVAARGRCNPDTTRTEKRIPWNFVWFRGATQTERRRVAQRRRDADGIEFRLRPCYGFLHFAAKG